MEHEIKLPLTEALARRVAELRAHFDDVPPEHRQCFTDRANELDFYRQKLLDAEQPEDAANAADVGLVDAWVDGWLECLNEHSIDHGFTDAVEHALAAERARKSLGVLATKQSKDSPPITVGSREQIEALEYAGVIEGSMMAAHESACVEAFVAGSRWREQYDARRPDTAFAKLRDAVRALYYAACWSADRPLDEAALWTAVRDAAGFAPGSSPKPIEQAFRET